MHLTSLLLFGIEAEELPPPGAYLSSLQQLSLASCKAQRVRPCFARAASLASRLPVSPQALAHCRLQLTPALTAATGLTKLAVQFSLGLYLDQIWVQLPQLLPAWPLLKVSATRRVARRSRPPLATHMLTLVAAPPSRSHPPSLSPQELDATQLVDDDIFDIKLLTGELLIELGCASEDESEAESAGQGQA